VIQSHPKNALRAPSHHQNGLTLFELLIVLVIAAIVLGMGSPTFSDFRRNARLTNAANEFLASVQLARTEAIKRQRTLSLCSSGNPSSAAVCDGGPFTSWIVFVDADGDCVRSADEEIVRTGDPLDREVVVAANGACLSFASSGFIRPMETPSTASEILFCDPHWKARLLPGSHQSAARGVLLTPTGRAHITRDPAMIEAWSVTCG
jgi:type IV fimbrial biogenesis protein FimT